MPLPREHLLDELATAYVQVVAATAGATIDVSRSDCGVYGTLSHVAQASEEGSQGHEFTQGGFAVDFQIKGTTAATVLKDHVVYDLNARNYDRIVGRPLGANPLYLFLVCFNSEDENWTGMQKEQLILRASAYWWKRSGLLTKNSSTVRIEVPVVSRLTPHALQYMLEASRNKFGLQFDGGELAAEPALTEIEADRRFRGTGGAKDQSGTAGPSQTVSVRLTVNGTAHTLTLDPRSSLLDVLREVLALTGAKKGCDHGQCGACTVHLDGRAVVSCLTPAVQADGRQVTTIEGLSPPGADLHPMQQAFIDHDALQCGYCTPGQIMAAVACVSEGHATSPEQIREYMSGNICRCGAYAGIVAAIQDAAPKMRRA